MTRLAFMTNGEYDTEISVDMAKLRFSPHECIQDKPGFGVGEITVADVESLGFSVRHEPQPDNLAHALVLGDNNKIIARGLASRTKILIRPVSL